MLEFKLVLEPDRPTNGDLVLSPETPLSGVKFIEQVGKTLRRSIDTISHSRHQTLGALATYEMSVPQAMAIDSGLFETTDTVTVIVENDILSNFIFYGATIMNGPSGRACYPYLNSEATLVSYIDELAFLDAWANTGYATRLAMNNGKVVSVYLNTGCPSTGGDSTGGLGCDGCTCMGDPSMKDHHHHHRSHHPKPPVIGNPTKPPSHINGSGGVMA